MRINLSGNDWKLTGSMKNQWRLSNSMELGIQIPLSIPQVPAVVPGAVQADLLKAGLLDDPNEGLNSVKGEWVNNREWIYEKEFCLPEQLAADKLILCFEGLDYSGEIYLNGTMLGIFEGMFVPVEYDVTGKVNRTVPNRLVVVFYLAPEVDGQIGYSNMIRTLKSRFNYSWDWCPRIVSVGIWEDVYLKAYGDARIVDFFPSASLDSAAFGCVAAETELEAHTPGEYEFRYRVKYEGTEVFRQVDSVRLLAARQTVRHELAIGTVASWWPNGQGVQPLYEIELEIYRTGRESCDRTVKRIGFRDVKFVQNQDAPDGALPYTLTVNGKRIFLRGINWVPLSPLYGTVTGDQYRNILQRFKDMNCNLLRVWGGAILEKQAFYDLCDELGLMVWQEFPQSSSGLNNTPPDDRDFLKVLEETATVFIRRRRHHACHILWCGGNELMWEGFRPVDEAHANIRLLKGLVEKLDAGKHFLPSSASGPRFCAAEEDFGKGVHHDVHGPWNYLGAEKQYAFFNGDDSLFRSETGCPGASRMETLEKYKDRYSVWPPDSANPYWAHRGLWWIQLEELTGLFGEWDKDGKELEAYLDASRALQAEALRYVAEAVRRREPFTSGFLIWMGNEPFPNNSNTSVIEYDGTPKPSYYWVRNAFSKLHVSARYAKLSYAAGEGFEADIYVTADDVQEKKVKVTACILDLSGNPLKQESWEEPIGNYSVNLGKVEWTAKPTEGNVFLLRLVLECGDYQDENCYVFTVDAAKPLEPLRRLPKAEVVLQKAGETEWLAENLSGKAAVNVFLYGKNPEDFVKVFPNCFTLLPGEKKLLQVESLRGSVGLDEVRMVMM